METSTRNRWTEELIRQRILQCKQGLDLDRMPTLREMNAYYGNQSLSHKVSTSLGVHGWASVLGLPSIACAVHTGLLGRQLAAQWLRAQGFSVEAAPRHASFDFLLDGAARVAVKLSNLRNSDKNTGYCFCLSGRRAACDFYLLIAQNGKQRRTFYMVPADCLPQTGLSMGKHRTSLLPYRNRTDLIDEFLSAGAAKAVS